MKKTKQPLLQLLQLQLPQSLPASELVQRRITRRSVVIVNTQTALYLPLAVRMYYEAIGGQRAPWWFDFAGLFMFTMAPRANALIHLAWDDELRRAIFGGFRRMQVHPASSIRSIRSVSRSPSTYAAPVPEIHE